MNIWGVDERMQEARELQRNVGMSGNAGDEDADGIPEHDGGRGAQEQKRREHHQVPQDKVGKMMAPTLDSV